MPYTQPNRSPESCRNPLCGYLERITEGVHTDRCKHNIPMYEKCAWHRTPNQIKTLEAQEQMTTQRIREPAERKDCDD